MPAPNPLAALYLGLDASPGDKVTLYALADWYEENGWADAAAAIRWTIRRGLFPFRYSRDAGLSVFREAWHEGWYWWANDGPDGSEWGYPTSCCLPHGVWQRLAHGFAHPPSIFKEYPSQRDAYETLFDVWPLVEHLANDRFRGTRR
jgi:hypothetical protein